MTTTHTYLDHGIKILKTRITPSSVMAASHSDAPTTPFITLSREACAGATTLGDQLIPILNEELSGQNRSWIFFDKDLITHVLTKHHLPERLEEYLPEDRHSEIKALIGELVGLHPPVWELEHKVTEAILHLARLGSVILTGRASNFITRELPGGLHIRLVASMEARIKRMMEIRHCDAAAAKNALLSIDHARYRYVHTKFQHDIEDPHSYDLVINTDRISRDCAVQLVVRALRERVLAGSEKAASAG